ncbi:major vault protein [Sarotherodon galilaeus]
MWSTTGYKMFFLCLLGDYDKVKALSEGSDCRCKCVVRPLSRSACRRIEEGSASAQDFYTVETITSGPECKCACIAPPSAVNPCEGEYRLKKLREAGNENVKLSTILELLEGSFYGMDLLKLHSVTNKLIDRVDHIEKHFLLHLSILYDVLHSHKRFCLSNIHTLMNPSKRNLGYSILLKNTLACRLEQPGIKPPTFQLDSVDNNGSGQIIEVGPQVTLKSSANKEASQVSKAGSSGMIIRGMTFYKSEPDPMVADDGEPGENLHPTTASTTATSTQAATTKQPEETTSTDFSGSDLPQTPTALLPAALTTSSSTTTTTTSTTTTTTTTKQAAQVKQRYKISWEEEGHMELDEPMQRHEESRPKKPEECKDTLATISEPVTHNTYGRNEGAWMKDPKSDNGKIYVTNFYYGNNLLEFRNLEVFKQGRFSNSYKLPYNWIGTGHVVYGGAFYYNRAFSRDIIKFDLRQRYVAAWTMLHDALYEDSSSPWDWRSHSDIDFAVDESGLWIIYPALDDEGFLQEVVVLSRLDPSDLTMQRETTWRTGLKRNHFGNCFVVCGVLYAVDSYNQRDANLEYAFDTHTNTQMIPRMPFINNYTYTTQIDYNPKEGVLYAWDNGHQVTYNIKFAYVDAQ